MNRQELWKLFTTSAKNWLKNNESLRAAALTFFIILPLPPLLLIVQTIFAQFVGPSAATQQLVQQISAFAGPVVAELFQQLLSSSMSPFNSVSASIAIVGFSVGGIIGAFAVLRQSLNVIWQVKQPLKSSLSARIKHNIGPFVIVSSLGLIVIAAEAVASTIFEALTLLSINQFFTSLGIQIAHIFLSLGLSIMLFAIIYKVIPEAKIQWTDVLIAAVTTGVAFTVINYILGTYIQTFPITTIIGSGGALLILLLWIFILNEIVLFGAEISRVYTTDYGKQKSKNLSDIGGVTRPLEVTGEKVEAAIKGVEIQPPRKNNQANGSNMKEQTNTLAKEQKVSKKLDSSQRLEPSNQQKASSVEITVKVNRADKKKKHTGNSR